VKFAGDPVALLILKIEHLRGDLLQLECSQIKDGASFVQLCNAVAQLGVQILDALFRSVKSYVTFAKPHSSPSVSCSGVIITDAQNTEPSFFARQPSSEKRPSFSASASSRAGQPLAPLPAVELRKMLATISALEYPLMA
jgi:hypothetical protein